MVAAVEKVDVTVNVLMEEVDLTVVVTKEKVKMDVTVAVVMEEVNLTVVVTEEEVTTVVTEFEMKLAAYDSMPSDMDNLRKAHDDLMTLEAEIESKQASLHTRT